MKQLKLKKHLIITVDGHSSCGKSTLAKDIAQAMGYIYIDSGAMYRAVTLYLLRHHAIIDNTIDQQKLNVLLDSISITFHYNTKTESSETILNNENVEQEIRSMEVNNHVSPVSKIKSVRTKLVELQRKMGKNKQIVMDGRDIGSVVFPNADLKIFLTADIETRAQRRFDELQNKNIRADFNEVKENLITRDHIDSTRTESPLIKSDDAVTIDNSGITREQQLEKVMAIICKRFGN
jgi:cytidylate kinase